MSECSRCESLPQGWPEVGILYLSPPLAHTWGTLKRLLWESGLLFGGPLGVETEEQWWWLLAHDADFAQGYLFANSASLPPVPAST